MRIDNDKLPKVATNGFFYRKFHHGFTEMTPMAPIKVTAKRLYCCETTTETVSRRWKNIDMEEITEKTSSMFAPGPQGSAIVHVIPKRDYPKTRTWTWDHGR